MVRTLLRGIAAGALLALAAQAQDSPMGQAQMSVGDKSIVIEYGRPSLRGRDMLGRLQVGETWRMGASVPTTLKTEADLAFGEIVVPKGDYVLRAKKLAEDQWHLLVRNDSGAFNAEIPFTSNTLPASVEMFTISLKPSKNGGELALEWATMALTATFTAR
jgi:hypothetical protein